MSGTVIVLGAGASQGVGGALGRRFASEGHHVIMTGRTASKVEALAAEISNAGGSAESLAVDVTSQADLDALFSHADRVPKTSSNGRPAEKPRNSIASTRGLR